MKKCVYSVLVNDYDFVFPPIMKDADVDYILFTEHKNFLVSGWSVRYIEEELLKKLSSLELNRYYKMLPHLFLSDYDISIYIDANIRVMGNIDTLVNEFINGKYDIGLRKHPFRNNVMQEISACIRLNKLSSKRKLFDEYDRYMRDGFLDNLYLTENGIIIRAHNNKKVIIAMEFWWECFLVSAGRDQISLPFVRQKYNLKEMIYQFDIRDDDRYFKLYPHKTNNPFKNLGTLLYVKGFTNNFFRILSQIYNFGLRCILLVIRLVKKVLC